MAEPLNEAFEEELNVLRSIFEKCELKEERSREEVTLKFQINPDFEFNPEEQTSSRRCCSLQLEITAKSTYPQSSPNVAIKNPRGLTDGQLQTLNMQISSLLAENKEQPILYDIIRLAQDFLAHKDISLPKLPCSICLSNFSNSDSIFITGPCHHHFHSSCMGRYVQHCIAEKAAENELLALPNREELEEVYCPICRTAVSLYELKNSSSLSEWIAAAAAAASTSTRGAKELSYYSETLGGCSSSTTGGATDFDWRELANPIERHFKEMYEKQKMQNGLIDLEEEKKRMLVTDDTKVYLVNEDRPSTSGISYCSGTTTKSSENRAPVDSVIAANTKESEKQKNVKHRGSASFYNNSGKNNSSTNFKNNYYRQPYRHRFYAQQMNNSSSSSINLNNKKAASFSNQRPKKCCYFPNNKSSSTNNSSTTNDQTAADPSSSNSSSSTFKNNNNNIKFPAKNNDRRENFSTDCTTTTTEQPQQQQCKMKEDDIAN